MFRRAGSVPVILSLVWIAAAYAEHVHDLIWY